MKKEKKTKTMTKTKRNNRTPEERKEFLLNAVVNALMKGLLSPDERLLLRLRFGIGHEKVSLAEAAKLLEVTPEKAQRMENHALAVVMGAID